VTDLVLITYVLCFFVALLIHEIGHLVAARACRVRVMEFGLGWGPQVYSFRHGTIEYKLHALPIGAYVRLDMEELQRKPLSQQALILLAGVIVNLVAASATPGTHFSAVNFLLAATNLLPLYQQDGWKCGMVLLRSVLGGRRSALVEWTFTIAGGISSMGLLAVHVLRHL
jgi:membrane-associated protease RseP (regulator of RpoE activity)